MAYRVLGLPLKTASCLIGLDDVELALRGAKRYISNDASGFPCRITLQDAPVGEQVLLFNFEHQPADTPFRSRHAIFVREHALSTYDQVGPLPEQLSSRLLSIRAFDAAGMMLDADIVEGVNADPLIERLLGNVDVAYLHAHYARRGCYAARIQRA